MSDAIEILRILAGSWPLAVIVVGLAMLHLVRRLARRDEDRAYYEMQRGERVSIVPIGRDDG